MKLNLKNIIGQTHGKLSLLNLHFVAFSNLSFQDSKLTSFYRSDLSFYKTDKERQGYPDGMWLIMKKRERKSK